jgi:hypothetical protein
MFSTIDAVSNRFVRARVLRRVPRTGEELELKVKVPEEQRYGHALDRAKAEPSAESAALLGKQLATGDWFLMNLDQIRGVSIGRREAANEKADTAALDLPADPVPDSNDSGVVGHIVVSLSKPTAKAFGAERVPVEGAKVEIHQIIWDWTDMSFRSVQLVEKAFHL